MKNSEFVAILKCEGYSHKIKSRSVIVTQQGDVHLAGLTSLPEGIKFENQGGVNLVGLKSMPKGFKFENQGSVHLDRLKSIPKGLSLKTKGTSICAV